MSYKIVFHLRFLLCVGLMGSIVVSGYGFGSLVWIPAETAFVNPDNIKPAAPECLGDVECEEVSEKYFTDSSLLEKVPYSFLLLGGIIGAMSLIGILLTNEPKEKQIKEEKETEAEDNISVKALTSLTPMQVLKTRIFYLIWFGLFAISFAQGLLVNWQKTFGLTLITSDKFHSNIGIVTSFCNGAARIFWGLMYDKLGYKICMLIVSVTVTIGIAALPLLTYLNPDTVVVRVVWALLMVVLYSTFPGVYALCAAVCNSAFGPDFYSANFGLLFTSVFFYNSILIIFTQVPILFNTLGYTGMFLIGGGAGAVGVLITACMPAAVKLQMKQQE